MKNNKLEGSEPVIKKQRYIGLLLIVFFLLLLFSQIGFYTVQPARTFSRGSTIIVWRKSGEKLFNSPDGVCLQFDGRINSICRAETILRAPIDRTIIQLPYQHWAYKLSVYRR